ncbi:Hypothetical protein FKW44_002763, partial [Caligus rogercresseyi]
LPDLNPMDYFFRTTLSDTPTTGSQHPKARPDQLHNEAGQEVGQGLVAKACSSFRAGSSASLTQRADGLNKQNLHICTSILMSK